MTGASLSAQTSRQSPNFDRVARVYRWAEYLALGTLLRRTREQFLPELAGTQQALVLGDGDGRFAAALLRRAPDCHLHAVDSSAAMLALLGKRCGRDQTGPRLTLEQASVLDVHASTGCDLIATHFLLDCLTQAEVELLARRLAAQVKPPCRWVISEFGRPRGRLLGVLGAAYVRLLYASFRMLTGLRVKHLPDPQKALQNAGFLRLQRVERLGGLLYSELWTAP
ncbi:MAG: class I SAM-dependent methyltransferase [Janthinobacterium lividum]